MIDARLSGDVRHSTVSRAILLAASAATIWMNARVLGPEGQGFAALFGLAMLTISSIGAFVAGGAVVYLRRQFAPRDLWLPGMVWLTIVTAAVSFAGVGSGWLPAHWALDIGIAGWLQAAAIFHGQLALACDEVKLHNALSAGQILLTSLLLATLYFGFGFQSEDAWVTGLLIGLLLTFLASLRIFRYIGRPIWRISRPALSAMWRHGRSAASGGLLQMWTNRSNLALLERAPSAGIAATGVYAVAFYGLEAIWAFSRGLAPVLHSRIAGMSDVNAADRRALTRRFTGWALAATAPLAAVAALTPDSVYLWIFGFEGISPVLRALTPLMLTGAVCSVWAHYLSGIGAHIWNAMTSGAGLLTLLILAPSWIASDGAVGAAWAASVAGAVQILGLGLALRRLDR
jgi:O-antigen/teichoic acid export membrane protein